MHILVFWAAALALAPLGLGIVLQALSASRGVPLGASPAGKRERHAPSPAPIGSVAIRGEV